MAAAAEERGSEEQVAESGEIEKVFDATIDVANPTHFCTEKFAQLRNEIETKFIGRCYKGALILRNIRVLQASACRINDSNGAGEGSIDVQFAATVRVFCRWDIITGVEVRVVAPVVAGHYTVRNADAQAFVVLARTKGIETLAIGQRIPVRITKAEHPVRQPAVVYGALLTCDGAFATYRLRGALDPATAAEMMPMVNQITHELKLRAELIAKKEPVVAYFEALLYSYRSRPGAGPASCSHSEAAWPEGPEWRGPAPLRPLEAGLTARSVPAIVRSAAVGGSPVSVTGLWSRPLTIHRSAPIAAYAEGASASMVLDETPRVVFALFLKNILDFLVAVRELATDHSSPETDETYGGLWATMRLAQVAPQ